MSQRFQYRLQQLLDQKLHLKEEAERELAARQTELRKEREHLEELKGEQEKLSSKREQLRLSMFDATSLASGMMGFHQDYLRGLELDIEQAKDAVFSQRIAIEDAEDRVTEAQKSLAARTREADILKKHREKSEARWQREQDRKEELEQEEIGAAMYRRNAT